MTDVEKRRLIAENSILRNQLMRYERVGEKLLKAYDNAAFSDALRRGDVVVVPVEEDRVESARRTVLALADLHRRFYRLDVLEEAARAVCRECRWGVDLMGAQEPPQVLHEQLGDVRVTACFAGPIRRLQMEEWS